MLPYLHDAVPTIVIDVNWVVEGASTTTGLSVGFCVTTFLSFTEFFLGQWSSQYPQSVSPFDV